ncbi:MAG TPA: DUF6600 domain-containing protein [Burkholderiaceae bacterium]|nr:DUF6600 domain-containing protein [Burkholderiaceae bacterium]
MNRQALRVRFGAFVAAVALLAFSGWASADPPSRVARLGYLSGAISFSPAGEDEWDRASINRPLTTGDRLWSDAGARAEIQIGGALIRMDAGTGVSLLNLDDQVAQLQLTQGTLHVRVRRLGPDQEFEVDTPNLAFTLRQPGVYRISVDPDRDTTTIVMRSGRGEAYGDDGAYRIEAGQAYRFGGTGLRDAQVFGLPRADDFDRWAGDRDRRHDSSVSARYVSPDVIGYQDLDEYGSWRSDASYGNVWFPSRVESGWAPYRDGHWAWIDPWGWTWVDDAPWGFAVSHYGRWAHFDGRWGWVPGPVRVPAYYAPALVVFIGGDNFQLTISSGGSIGGVAWFPLGPREVYRPAYPVSRSYFENVNRSNTVINNTVITNVYNNVNVTNIVYANRRVPGAVVAVPKTTFVQSEPISKAMVRVAPEAIVDRPAAAAAPVAPTQKSVRGAAPQAEKPPQRVFERPVIARSAPPPAHPGFAAQEAQLATTPGKPLDDTARKALKPATAAVAPPQVKVVAPAKEPPRVLSAPSVAPPVARSPAADARPDAPRGRSAPPAAAASRPAAAAVPEAEAGKAKTEPPRGRAIPQAPQRPPPPAAKPPAPPPVVAAPQPRTDDARPAPATRQRGQPAKDAKDTPGAPAKKASDVDTQDPAEPRRGQRP